MQFHEFDPPQDSSEWDICQLIPGTADGFPEMENQELMILLQENHRYQCTHWSLLHMDHESHCDPPGHTLQENYYDPPHEDEYIDPPHEDNYDPPHD